MAIQATQTPNTPFNMAYGPNPVTLDNISSVNGDKYVLQIFKLGGAEPIADLRQSPNRLGKAIFDIQNSLQTLVGPSNNNLDGLHYDTFQANQRLRIADGELQQYILKIGDETNGTVTVDQWNGTYTTLGGLQPYYVEQFPTDDYIPAVTTSVAGCTTVNRFGKALSDNQWSISKFDTNDELLQDFTESFSDRIDVHNVYMDDQCTKSFYNLVERGQVAGPELQGIEAYWIVTYNGQQYDQLEYVLNTQANGGGPNVGQDDGVVPTQNYLINTIATGPANIAESGIIDSSTTHYYILPTVQTTQCDFQYGDNLMEGSAWRAQRYNIIKEDCNDYPHIQFAWMNSKGMRDQFTFTKKNEKKVSVKRNEFLKESADYNGSSYSVDIHDRGYTTYSQQIKETYTVTSGFINDQEAQNLESLIRSADVNVRFSEGDLANQWQPVRLQTNSYIQKTNRKDRLFQYTITFTIAHNLKSQRG